MSDFSPAIISKLADVNRRSTYIADTAYIKETAIPPAVKYELRGRLGWAEANESDLAWTPLSFENVPADARVKVTGTGAWYHFKHVGYRSDNSLNFDEVTQTATTENFIFVPESIPASGKTEITIFGRTRVDIRMTMNMKSSSGWAMNQWSTKINIDSSKPEKPVIVTTEEKVRGETTSHANDDEFGANIIVPVKQQLEQLELDLTNLAL